MSAGRDRQDCANTMNPDSHAGFGVPHSHYSHGHTCPSESNANVIGHANVIDMKKPGSGLRVEASGHCSVGSLAQKLGPRGGEKILFSCWCERQSLLGLAEGGRDGIP